MVKHKFITIRLGKDSVADINRLCEAPIGILKDRFSIVVRCTQVPDNYGANDYAFIWLGSDNNKGMPTKWKQGFKSVGIVKEVKRGEKYNDVSETTIEIVYVFGQSINRLDILRSAPSAYYWCSSMPLIGIDDHANQTIRSMSGENLCSIKAFFCMIDMVTHSFKRDITLVNSEFSKFFDTKIFSPKDYPMAKILEEITYEKAKMSLNNVSNTFLQFLTALRTKPFMLLAGISGTGKSRIVRKLAQATVTEELQRANGYTGEDFANDRWTLHSPANFELIQVKPNWHNSMDVIGYLSNIPSPHYVFTPFIEFIVKAWQHPEVPFFLCLDEMNLAPVEEYFAEFLSAIESRSFGGGEYMTDPIIKPFNSFGKEVAKMMVNTLFPNFTAADKNSFLGKIVDHLETKGLTLPKNLIVIGTVNMDETTFSFSRKVLDRAMSVEMNEVNYDSFLNDTTDDDLNAIVQAFEDNKDADLNALLVDRHIEAKEIIDELGDDAKFAIDYLKRINALLEGTPFKLGYRAANEALIYLQASQEFGQTDRIAALDNFTLMKILSRIEGDESKLKITDSEADKDRIANAEVNVDEAKQYGDLNILTALRNIITVHLGKADNIDRDITEETAIESDDNMEHTEKSKKDLQSIKKIDSMLSQLKRDHFVSFWN
ncbi:MAG: hypothetical protein SPF85_09610 [Alloprevotella sp.]|nr:hypothetical protein [Alloprevotella sp.]